MHERRGGGGGACKHNMGMRKKRKRRGQTVINNELKRLKNRMFNVSNENYYNYYSTLSKRIIECHLCQIHPFKQASAATCKHRKDDAV